MQKGSSFFLSLLRRSIMHIASKTFAIAILLFAPVGCGSSSSGGAGGSTGSTTTGTGSTTTGGPTVAEACAASAHASCTQRDTCSLNSYENEKIYGSEADCETRTALTCPDALMAKGTGQTPTTVEACVAAYPTYTCTAFYDSDPPAACVPPAGTGVLGSACGADAQCETSFCAIGEYTVCATCATLPAAGALCQVQADCGRDLACAKTATATAGVCAEFVAAGGACLTDVNPCAAGLSCVGDVAATKTMGACQTAGATVGAACDGDHLVSPSCNNDLGLVCIPTVKGTAVGTCQAITLVAAGMACGDLGSKPITGFADCTAGGLCVKAATTDTVGTCVAPAADNAACDNDPTKGPPCLPPAKCVPASAGVTTGTCTVPDAATCM
jgi:hypothetical protein